MENELSTEMLRERMIDITDISMKRAEVLCWRLDGRIKRQGDTVYIVYTPTRQAEEVI